VGAAAREFFETLETRVDPAQTAGINKTYRFEVDGAGAWTVAVTDEGVRVTEGGDEEADTTISTSEDTFEALLEGKQSATTAFMLGKVKVAGDMGAAMKLQKLFSSRPS
jgi:putative sterol carrier protein